MAHMLSAAIHGVSVKLNNRELMVIAIDALTLNNNIFSS